MGDDHAPELRWTFLGYLRAAICSKRSVAGLAQYAALRSGYQPKTTTRNCSLVGYLKMASTAFGTAWLTATMLNY
jgi:hypothetical protein